MARVAFVRNSSAPEEKIEVDFDGSRSTLDAARLKSLLASPEPAINPSDTWLVQTGRDLFQLLGIRAEDLADNRILDFTGLPATHMLTTLPWELLHDGIQFLAQQAIPIVRIVRQVNRKSSVTENRALSTLYLQSGRSCRGTTS